ncbi:MAG: nuclear transport factor 2 family protein, partial [Anaerolineales bacterium]
GLGLTKLTQAQLKEQVIQRELEWAKAHRDLDLVVIEEILSDDFQSLQPEGSKYGKAELLKSYGSGDRVWDIAESTHHHVQITGDLAVLVGRWRGKGINTGEAFDYQSRFLSIYRNEAGVWRMILELSLPIRQ